MVIITDVIITKKIICGYASAFGRPIDNGYVANTAAAKPRGIITEVTFLVRAFFFVFVGLLASFAQIEYVIFGIIAAIAIYIGRILITKTVLVRGFSKLDKKVTSVMIPRGLAAAVLATYPLSMGLPNAEAYPQIIFFVVITSVIITTLGLGGAKKIPPPESHDGGFIKKEKEKEKLSE